VLIEVVGYIPDSSIIYQHVKSSLFLFEPLQKLFDALSIRDIELLVLDLALSGLGFFCYGVESFKS